MEPSDLNEIEDLNLRFRSKFTEWRVVVSWTAIHPVIQAPRISLG